MFWSDRSTEILPIQSYHQNSSRLTDLNGLRLLDVCAPGAALSLGSLSGDDLDVDERVSGLRDVVDAVVQLGYDAVEAGAYRYRRLVRLDLQQQHGGSDLVIGWSQ